MKRLQNTLTEDDVKEAVLKADGFVAPINEIHGTNLQDLTNELNKILEDILRDL